LRKESGNRCVAADDASRETAAVRWLPTRAERAVLEDLQQLDLNWHGDVADFIEKMAPWGLHRAITPSVRFDCTSERPFAMAEELGFISVFPKLRQVERDELRMKLSAKAAEFFIEGNVTRGGGRLHAAAVPFGRSRFRR